MFGCDNESCPEYGTCERWKLFSVNPCEVPEKLRIGTGDGCTGDIQARANNAGAVSCTCIAKPSITKTVFNLFMGAVKRNTQARVGAGPIKIKGQTI